MSAKSFLTLCRRLWAVRTQLDDAYLVYNYARWQALLKREAKLQALILSYVP